MVGFVATSMVVDTPLQKRQKILQQRKSLPIATGFISYIYLVSILCLYLNSCKKKKTLLCLSVLLLFQFVSRSVLYCMYVFIYVIMLGCDVS